MSLQTLSPTTLRPPDLLLWTPSPDTLCQLPLPWGPAGADEYRLALAKGRGLLLSLRVGEIRGSEQTTTYHGSSCGWPQSTALLHSCQCPCQSAHCPRQDSPNPTP